MSYINGCTWENHIIGSASHLCQSTCEKQQLLKFPENGENPCSGNGRGLTGKWLFLLADITFSLINQTGFLLKTRSVTRRRK